MRTPAPYTVAPSTVAARTVGQAAQDDGGIAAFADDFTADSGDWLYYRPELVGTDSFAAGENNLAPTAGGVAGSLWFDGFDGFLKYKLITGDVDVRARIRVRNTADDFTPPTSNFRIAGLAAHDPDRSTNFNYVHIGAGSVNNGADNRIEWKTTDNSVSTYGANGSAVSPLDVDVRLVRVGQVFTPYWRASAGLLSDAVGWTALQVMDRSNNATPARASAVVMPDTLQWGLIVYASVDPHDIRMFVDQVLAMEAA